MGSVNYVGMDVHKETSDGLLPEAQLLKVRLYELTQAERLAYQRPMAERQWAGSSPIHP